MYFQVNQVSATMVDAMPLGRWSAEYIAGVAYRYSTVEYNISAATSRSQKDTNVDDCQSETKNSLHGRCLYSISGRTSCHKISRNLEAGDSCFDLSNCSEIWQAPRQQRCRDVCQISERYDNYNIQSHGFETSRDLAVKRLTAQWIEALGSRWPG